MDFFFDKSDRIQSAWHFNSRIPSAVYNIKVYYYDMNFKSAQRKFVEKFQQTFIKMPFKLEMFAKFFYLYLDTNYKTQCILLWGDH